MLRTPDPFLAAQEIVLAAQIIDAKDTRPFPRGTRGQKGLYKGLLPEDIGQTLP